MRKLLLILSAIVTLSAQAQQINVTGVVRDSLSGDVLPFTGVRLNEHGMYSGINGDFKVSVSKGVINVVVFHVGYIIKKFNLVITKDTVLNVRLARFSSELNAVVVSGSKYGKTIAEEVVSITSVNTDYVTTRNLDAADKLLNRIPGVTIMDGQPQIRGGSGYAYGAGSRVQVLYDDMPLISADAGDVKWDMLPMESTGKIEVLKGAGSVLYGSGAIDGVINFRPAIPTDTPHIQLSIWHGIYGEPRNSDMMWWNIKSHYANGSIGHVVIDPILRFAQTPDYSEGTFNWLQKFGKIDLNAGLNEYRESSFREGESYQRVRANILLTWHVNKRLKLGIGSISQYNNNTTFFLWQNNTYGAYLPSGGLKPDSTTLSHIITKRYTVSPSADYYAANGDKHTLRLQLFYNNNDAIQDNNQTSKAWSYYAQYQYQHTFTHRLLLTAGAAYTYNNVNSLLYGNHFSRNPALFTQLEYKYRKLTLQGGVRAESFEIDTARYKLKPLFRAGANYNIWPGGFVRASIGQGFRYPAIAEKFTSTILGAFIVQPNPGIQPEHGYSSEIGMAQFFKIGRTTGLIDLAVFDMQTRNFIDFTFVGFGNNFEGLKFKAVNVENASITGAELTFTVNSHIGKVALHFMGGVTGLNPININAKKTADSTVTAYNNLSNENPKLYPALTNHQKDSIYNQKYLPYRNRLSAKMSISADYKKWTFYTDINYTSFMINVDPVLELIPGVETFRQQHPYGTWVFDAGIGYNFTKKVTLGVIVRNLFNAEYTYRPALLEEPINYSVKATFTF